VASAFAEKEDVSMTDYTPLLTRLRAATVPEQSDLIVALAELIAGDDEPFVRRIKYLCVYNAFESATIAITGRALPGWEWSIASGSKHHEIRPYATVQEQFADAPEIENAPTPALALCIAIVEALEARNDG
jgi:hypothetical protein